MKTAPEQLPWYLDEALYKNVLFIIRLSLPTCPMPAPMLPLPSMIPVTVAIALSLPSMGPPRPATDKHPHAVTGSIQPYGARQVNNNVDTGKNVSCF